MDARKVAGLVVVLGVAVFGAFVAFARMMDDVVHMGFGAASEGPVVAVDAADSDAEPSLYGVPTAAQQRRLEAAKAEHDRPKSLQDLIAGQVPEKKEPEVWRPPVVEADTRPVRAGPGTGAEPERPLTPNVVGLERALVQKKEVIDLCMRWNAPARTGEDSVPVDFTIVPDGAANGKITKVEIKSDTTGRYAAFAQCLLEAVQDVRFTALRTPQEVVSWAFRR